MGQWNGKITASIDEGFTIGNLPECFTLSGDQRLVRIKAGVALMGRISGRMYVVDSSLAHHWCDVIGVAEMIKLEDVATPAVAENMDRAMKQPPRGGRRK